MLALSWLWGLASFAAIAAVVLIVVRFVSSRKQPKR
jgi:hypothetical protein